MGNRARHKHHRSGDGVTEDGGIRILRLQELIKNETNILLRNEIRDRRLQDVDVTMVDLSRDGGCARIWVSAEAFDEVHPALDRAAGFIRSHLAETLGIKRVPELRFRRDNAIRTLDMQELGEPKS